METGPLLESRKGRVAILTLNRPEVMNALSNALFVALADAFKRLELDDEISVIIIRGSGRAFCAGGDVAEMPADSKTLTFEQRVTDLMRRADLMRLIAESRKVTIASINGAAVGAGLSVALACDFRVAARSAMLITGFINIGLSGDCGCIHLLTNIVGMAKAKELALLSNPLSGEEAAAIGAVTRCVDDDALEAETLALARRLAAGPPVAQRYMKENFRKTGEPLASALSDEAVFLVRSATTQDHAEAKKAFLEKRTPIFQGR